MSRQYGLVTGLRPEIFDAIPTPRIASVDQGHDGLPSYAKLEVLIAYLTAPSTLNYDTISDFLMTYRLYASSTDVWYLLASRLLWAASIAARTGTESETGRDVGTRTFVLIRQWFRDNFASDFVPNYKLREAVAETMTTLSGCTEFVLVEYFYRILSQIRCEWDGQISRYWILPSTVAGNIDSAVPVGGEQIDAGDIGVLNSISPVLSGAIPIDADIAVPSIQSSPPRRRPKAKLSTFFRRHRPEESKPEAVLHGKVDLLAMQLINEYHLRERGLMTIPREDSNNTLHPRQEPPQDSAQEFVQPTQEAEWEAVQPAQESEWEPEWERPEPTESTEPRGPTEPTESMTESATTSPVRSSVRSSAASSIAEGHDLERYVTPTPSVYDDEWATPRRSLSPESLGGPYTAKLNDTDDDNKATENGMVHEQSMDTLNMHDMALANTSADSEVDMDLADTAVPVNEEWGMVDYDQFDQVSYSGSSLSTLSTSTRSAFSYRGGGGIGGGRSGSRATATDDSRSSIDRRSSSASHSISLLSEIDNSMLQPCAGYTASDAARLKSIPDYKLEGDALLATLRRLEGTDSSPAVVLPSQPEETEHRGIPHSSTIELYSQALDPSSRAETEPLAIDDITDTLAREVSQLGIAHSPSKGPQGSRGVQPGLPADIPASLIDEISPKPIDVAAANATAVTAPGSAAVTPTSMVSPSSPYTVDPGLPEPLAPTLHIGLPSATHAPFVLSYTARAVAEQMTYIESAVASQIDFSSLVRMDGHHTQAVTRKVSSWLQVVMEEPPLQNTMLVLARFDLVYRWVQSEIILCPSPALKAQAISRFVHISFEALRLQNFATMVQIVLALCSAEVQALLEEDVFKLLPAHDTDALERLESLASPAQDYSKLRKAHNRLSASKGCVPFTPMFLTDIELTAEAASSNAEQEIHFGKYRVAAQVVKSLQRYVQSGTNYCIEPEPALLSKCLYLASIPTL